MPASLIDALADELGQQAASFLVARVHSGEPVTQADFDNLKKTVQAQIAARTVEWRRRREALHDACAELKAALDADLSQAARNVLHEIQEGQL